MHIINKVTILTLCLALLAPALVFGGGGPNVSGAKLYVKQNDLDQALTVLLKEINERDANNEDAWYLLGYIYARQKKYDKMVEAFNKAVELKPKFKEENKGVKISGDNGVQFHSKFGAEMIMRIVWGDAFNAGVSAFNEGVNAPDDTSRSTAFEKAIENFKMAALIMPDSTLVHRNMAASYMNLGKYEESAVPLEKALEADSGDVDVKTMLAQVYMRTGKDSLAIPMLEELWESGVRSEDVADFLSRAYLIANETDKAKQIYKDALEVNPDNYHFRYNYGTVLLEANEYDGAIEQLLLAYEMNPEAADINYNVGAAYLNKGVAKRSELPEDSEDTTYKEEFKNALPYLEKAVVLNQDDPAIWFTLGRIAGQLNKITLSGYCFAKGEETRSALEGQLRVGMDGSTLKTLLGEPDNSKTIESEQFAGIEEWTYRKRAKRKGKLAIPDPITFYVKDNRVEALMVME